jgi:hypothetical protein
MQDSENAMTDDKSLPKDERKRLQIEHAPHLSIRAKQTKIAERSAIWAIFLLLSP